MSPSCIKQDVYNFSVDTSATESENETKALGIDSTTGKKIKGKKKKDRDKLLLKEKKKRLTKKLKEKKDKFKQRQNKIQLSKKPKFGPGRRTFKKNVSVIISVPFLQLCGRLHCSCGVFN